MRQILFEYLSELQSISAAKFLAIFSVSVSLTGILGFINIYVYSDWDFLTYLGLLIGIDTVLGTANAFMKGKLSSERASKVLIKIMLYCIVLITVHILISFKVKGEHPAILNWFDDTVFTALMAREAFSIFEKIALISPTLFPTWILKRLDYFDKNGKLPPADE